MSGEQWGEVFRAACSAYAKALPGFPADMLARDFEHDAIGLRAAFAVAYAAGREAGVADTRRKVAEEIEAVACEFDPWPWAQGYNEAITRAAAIARGSGGDETARQVSEAAKSRYVVVKNGQRGAHFPTFDDAKLAAEALIHADFGEGRPVRWHEPVIDRDADTATYASACDSQYTNIHVVIEPNVDNSDCPDCPDCGRHVTRWTERREAVDVSVSPHELRLMPGPLTVRLYPCRHRIGGQAAEKYASITKEI